MMPSFVPGNFATMLWTGKLTFGRVGGEGVVLYFIALQVGLNVFLNFLVIGAADWPWSESDDFLYILHRAISVEVRWRT